MKIAHESPNSIFPLVRSLTDYDYCLVHLLEENEEYLRHFEQSKRNGRELILDNSIFELGTAFDSDKFAYWVERLQPDWYIVPDVLEDYQGTVSNYEQFVEQYSNLPGQKIGVLQGKTYKELIDCYLHLTGIGVDKIAISFDYSYYKSVYVHQNKLVSWCEGRKHLLRTLTQDRRFDPKIPIHLLGCSLPQEFSYYSKVGIRVDSIDTSNPVVCGLHGISYTESGLDHKPSKKLFELIDHKATEEEVSLIQKNIIHFQKFTR